jgi:hypothetical protein
MDWSSAITLVRTKTTDQIDIELGSDRYLPYATYKEAYGDPDSNGKNHRRLVWMNEDCVMIPGPKEWVVKRRRLHEVSKVTTQATSGLAIDVGHLDMNFQDLSSSMFAAFPKASGCISQWYAYNVHLCPTWPPVTCGVGCVCTPGLLAASMGFRDLPTLPTSARCFAPDCCVDFYGHYRVRSLKPDVLPSPSPLCPAGHPAACAHCHPRTHPMF